MTVINMDCVEGMKLFPDAYFDSIVTDPPYELGFMGKTWDATGIAYSVEMWREAMRVLKPGGHLLAFSGSRTYHRMVCAIEDAGFEIRDQIMWVYGSGFPKSLDVSKAIDKARDDTAEIRKICAWLGDRQRRSGVSLEEIDAACGLNSGGATAGHWTAGPARKIARVAPWEHWLIVKRLLALSDEMDAEVWRLNGRKGSPGEAWAEREVTGSTTTSRLAVAPGQGEDRSSREVAVTAPAGDASRQWQGWGTALKPAHEPIVVARKPLIGTVTANVLAHGTGAINVDGCRIPGWKPQVTQGINSRATSFNVEGRWPANLIHDGSDEVLAAFPQAPGQMADASTSETQRAGQNVYGAMRRGPSAAAARVELDKSAARFFYCAKASKADRSEGNTHPTVKPTDLMRYLCRLVTPPGGTVLDPFTGSGSTGKAARLEGFAFIGFELSAEYTAIAIKRISEALK